MINNPLTIRATQFKPQLVKTSSLIWRARSTVLPTKVLLVWFNGILHRTLKFFMCRINSSWQHHSILGFRTLSVGYFDRITLHMCWAIFTKRTFRNLSICEGKPAVGPTSGFGHQMLYLNLRCLPSCRPARVAYTPCGVKMTTWRVSTESEVARQRISTRNVLSRPSTKILHTKIIFWKIKCTDPVGCVMLCCFIIT